MNVKKLPVAVVFLVPMLFGLVLMSAHAEEKLQQVVKLPDALHEKTKFLNQEFLVYTPATAQKGAKLPLLIFLHGRGERGNDIRRVGRHGPPKLVKNKTDFPFLLVSPQCLVGEKNKGWWRVDELQVLLSYVKKNYAVDEKQIYLTGLSMGGYGTWAWAASEPNTFAAVAPICGGGNPADAKKYGKLPIWAFHGDADSLVPVQKSRVMVAAIEKAGGNAKLTEYPGVKHDSWTKTYTNPELYAWFLSHTK